MNINDFLFVLLKVTTEVKEEVFDPDYERVLTQKNSNFNTKEDMFHENAFQAPKVSCGFEIETDLADQDEDIDNEENLKGSNQKGKNF